MTGRHAARLGELVGGKYRLVRFLAEGGMGIVYEAQHAIVRRRFAVKLLRADLADRREILTRFQREAEAAGGLESENVAAAVDFGVAPDGTPFIVMEYLVGENLATLLERDGPLPHERAADVVMQAARGTGAAHAAGIVHRDLKPQNLFLCRREDGTDLVKVLDFGVAKLQAIDDNSAATRTGTVLGTVTYMSPEQARGDKVIDHRADVYALGAILYELLSGRRPHPGDSYNAILHHICTQAAVPLASVAPALPAALVEVVGRALASDPQTRFPSAAALAGALGPLARRVPWPASPPPPSAGDAAVAPTEDARPRSTGAGAPPSAGVPAPRVRWGRVAAVAIPLVAAVAIAAALWLRTPMRPAPATATATATASRTSEPTAAPAPGPIADRSPPTAPPAGAAAATTASPPTAPAEDAAPARPASRARARARADGDAAPGATGRPPGAAPAPETEGATPRRPRPGQVTFDQQNPYD